MDMQSLKVVIRTEAGKGAARRTRRSGGIPGVIYGEGTESIGVQIDAHDLESVLHGAHGEHAILQVEVEEKPDLSGPVMLKEVQLPDGAASCVLEKAVFEVRTGGLTKKERQALEALSKCGADGATANEWEQLLGLNQTAFYRCLTYLIPTNI